MPARTVPRRHRLRRHMPGAVDTVDATGAGDAFAAGLLAW
jgi:sugar/nucleoside kinase (ribokinase family)